MCEKYNKQIFLSSSYLPKTAVSFWMRGTEQWTVYYLIVPHYIKYIGLILLSNMTRRLLEMYKRWGLTVNIQEINRSIHIEYGNDVVPFGIKCSILNMMVTTFTLMVQQQKESVIILLILHFTYFKKWRVWPKIQNEMTQSSGILGALSLI